jgi:hypothetical protein
VTDYQFVILIGIALALVVVIKTAMSGRNVLSKYMSNRDRRDGM